VKGLRKTTKHFSQDRPRFEPGTSRVQSRSVNLLKPKRDRDRVRKDSIRVEEKRKHLGESERRFISEGEKGASCYKVPRQCPVVLLIRIEWE
jgi:hypothetical protein